MIPKKTLEDRIAEAVDDTLQTKSVPATLRVTMTATLKGVVVGMSFGPSATNPLDQNRLEWIYPTLKDALLGIGEQIAMQVNIAAQQDHGQY